MDFQEAKDMHEGEVNLRELLLTILRGKRIIIMVSTVMVLAAFVYALKLPNVYKSQTVLIPTESKDSGLSGLGGLAAMAGISIGGGGSMTPDVAFSSLLSNYTFMKQFVINNNIDTYYRDIERDKKFVFALGYRGVYDFFKSSNEENDKKENYIRSLDANIFPIANMIESKMSISGDKQTGLITVSYSDSDRTFPPFIIEAFLHDASDYLVQNNLRIINRKLGYFEKELTKAESFELRQSISSMISGILKEKVMMKSKQYYQCDVLTAATPAYIKDKIKPKRGVILVVSFIASIIFGIFLVFFLEFFKGTKEEESTN